MQVARQRNGAPPQPSLAELAATVRETGQRADASVARAETILAAIEQGAALPEWVTVYEVSLIAAGLRGMGAGCSALADQAGLLAARVALADTELACARATGFQEAATVAAGRHRAPGRSRRPGRGQLALIPGEGKGAAVVSGVAAGAAFVRHSTMAKIVGGSAAAAVTAFTVSTTGMAHLPYLQSTPSHSAAASLPVLGPDVAIPISLPQSDPSYEGRHRAPASPDAASATAVPPAPVITVAPPSSAPPSSPSPQPSAAVSGTLTVQTVNVSIGIGGTGMLTFFSENGPLEWSASASPGLSLDRSGGILGDGQSVTLTVSVARGLSAGTGWVTISSGSQQASVPVTWISLPGL